MKDRQTILKETGDSLKAMDYFGLLCAEKVLNQIYQEMNAAGVEISPKIKEIIHDKMNFITNKIKNFK